MNNQPDTAWPTGKPGNPDPSAFKPPHGNPDAIVHGVLHPNEDKQEGGKEMGLVHAPIVSLNPTSEQPKKDIPEPTMIDNARFNVVSDHVNIDYSFADLIVGQGMFIPVETTTDALMSKVYKAVDQYRKQASEVARDENGDDIMVDEAINQKKRNEDGTVQLDNGVPRLGIKSGFVPKLIGPNFAVKAVVKGDKLSEDIEAEGDGALVIRMG